MAVPFAHRLQRSRYTGCFARRYIPSAMAMSSGIPIPNAAKTMWKASDMAICERAKRKSLIPLQRDRFQVPINPKDDLATRAVGLAQLLSFSLLLKQDERMLQSQLSA